MTCPDCKGTGEYVGFTVREPCRSCANPKAEIRFKYTNNCPKLIEALELEMAEMRKAYEASERRLGR